MYVFTRFPRVTDSLSRATVAIPFDLPAKLSAQYLSYASWNIIKPSLTICICCPFIYKLAENNHGCAAVWCRLPEAEFLNFEEA